MPKLTPVQWERFERFLLPVGYVLERREASHRVYWKEGLSRPVVLQAKGPVPVFIIHNDLRTLGIDRDTYYGGDWEPLTPCPPSGRHRCAALEADR